MSSIALEAPDLRQGRSFECTPGSGSRERVGEPATRGVLTGGCELRDEDRPAKPSSSEPSSKIFSPFLVHPPLTTALHSPTRRQPSASANAQVDNRKRHRTPLHPTPFRRTLKKMRRQRTENPRVGPTTPTMFLAVKVSGHSAVEQPRSSLGGLSGSCSATASYPTSSPSTAQRTS